MLATFMTLVSSLMNTFIIRGDISKIVIFEI